MWYLLVSLYFVCGIFLLFLGMAVGGERHGHFSSSRAAVLVVFVIVAWPVALAWLFGARGK